MDEAGVETGTRIDVVVRAVLPREAARRRGADAAAVLQHGAPGGVRHVGAGVVGYVPAERLIDGRRCQRRLRPFRVAQVKLPAIIERKLHAHRRHGGRDKAEELNSTHFAVPKWVICEFAEVMHALAIEHASKRHQQV